MIPLTISMFLIIIGMILLQIKKEIKISFIMIILGLISLIVEFYFIGLKQLKYEQISMNWYLVDAWLEDPEEMCPNNYEEMLDQVNKEIRYCKKNINNPFIGLYIEKSVCEYKEFTL